MNLEENRWQPQPGELAARIRLRQVQGWLFKEITVESGQRLLLSADGESLPLLGRGATPSAISVTTSHTGWGYGVPNASLA